MSMVCCRARVACGALTELCLNHGSEIFLRLLFCLGAPGGGVVVIVLAPQHVLACRADRFARRRLVRRGARRSRHCRRPCATLARATKLARSVRSLRIELFRIYSVKEPSAVLCGARPSALIRSQRVGERQNQWRPLAICPRTPYLVPRTVLQGTFKGATDGLVLPRL